MNGAESLVRSLVSQGVEVCFANPGTSEMHFVAALDKVSGLRCILGLHETVVTGAADGYARMAGKPAVTLLHTGPGLANGLSNIHNARKAWTPMVNIVGEHALSHIEHDAPLTADIEGLAAPLSHWVSSPKEAASLASAGAESVTQASRHPGHIATLVLAANTAWDEVSGEAAQSMPNAVSTGAVVDSGHIKDIAASLNTAHAEAQPVCFVLGGHCLHAPGLEMADRIAQQCNVTVLAETFKARFQRGAGRVSITEIPYPIDAAIKMLTSFKHVVTVCAKAPVGFFAYPDKPSTLYPANAQVHELAGVHDDGLRALGDLVKALGASSKEPRLQSREQHKEPDDKALDAGAIGILLANRMPENSIVVDEAVTSGVGVTSSTRSSAAHDWLEICGGSIGGGIPTATGAAVACPDRKVINLQADGSGMYSLQGLWTQAREKLNVTTIVFANSSYAILKHELDNVQASSGRVALDMMELDRPTLDWVALASGMGVTALRASTVDEFRSALETALAQDLPFLIEAVIP